MKLYLIAILAILLVGCQRHYLSVSQQWVDGDYLASSKVKTPDPRAANPPVGQMLVVDWFVPRDLLKQHPHIELDLIFWDYTTKKVIFPVESTLSWVTYQCFNQEYKDTKGILTYKATLVTEEGHVFREWKHQLWVNLIEVDKEASLP